MPAFALGNKNAAAPDDFSRFFRYTFRMWNKADIITLTQSPLFARFSEDEITSLLNELSAQIHAYKKSETVWSTGQKVSSLGVVLEGAVHVRQTDWWGNQNILHEIKPRDIFGESFATAENLVLPNDVVAAADSRILFVEVRWALSPQGAESPLKAHLVQNLYRISSARNRYLTKKVRYLSCRSTRDKLLAYFSEQARAHNSAQFAIPFDRQQLADYLSIERSAMSAELSRMQKDGLIRYKKNDFTLIE